MMSTNFHESPTSRYNDTTSHHLHIRLRAADSIPNLSPRYAHEKKIRIVPVKLSEVYPPQPPGRAGQQQNANILKESWFICFVNSRTCWRSEKCQDLYILAGCMCLPRSLFEGLCTYLLEKSSNQCVIRGMQSSPWPGDTHITWSWILK